MKTFILAAFAWIVTLIPFNVKAQTPQSFQYQAVVRDAAGNALINQSVNFQISILSGSPTGTVEFTETHTASTNAYGVVTLSIGGGTPVTGSLSGINWSNNIYFIKIEADPTGGTTYLDMGVTQLLSVPYALYAQTAANGGVNGISINWLGSFGSAPLSPSLNDGYYNSIDGISYIYDGSQWQIIAKDGVPGPQGPQGNDGPQGLQGNDGNPGQNGVSVQWLGDLSSNPSSPLLNQAYHNTNDGISYIYDGTSWQIISKDGLPGIQGPQGNQGSQGVQGLQGNQGLQGIQGLQGLPGQDGVSISWLGSLAVAPSSPTLNQAYYNTTIGKSYIYDGTSWQVISQDGATGAQGPQGLQGLQGNQGVAGINGVSISWLGTYASAPGSPTLNQAYYNSTDKKSYIWNGTAWQMIAQDGSNGTNGSNGVNGANGTNGNTIISGTVNPTTQGVNGDYYINTATNTLFGPKTAGVWGSGTSIIGPAGTNGTNGTNGAPGANGVNGYSVLNGTSNPTTQGVNGDFYINTTTNTIFGPKTAGAWGSGTSLVGPQGIQGVQGPAGTGLTNRGNWLSGTTYSNGDYVFDRSTSNPAVNSMWICQTSSFTSTTQPWQDAVHWVEFQAPAGPQGVAGTNGTDGKTILNGTVNPTTQGVNGDFYINTSTNTIFGPKAAGVWGSGTSLVGPQGAAGANGANGTNGTNGYTVLNGTLNPTTQGVNGDFYINTVTNTMFGPKTGGAWGSGTSLVGPAGTYTAGTGIQISAGTITNTSPDQTVVISSGTGMSVTGTYPNFTVTNASPNATHTGDVTGSSALTIASNAVTTAKIADGNVTAAKLNSMGAANGQVLKYNGTAWVPVADDNTTYTSGTGITVSGTVINAQTTTALWNANQIQGRGVLNTAPTAGQVIEWNGTNWAPATDNNSGTPGGADKTIQYNNAGVFAGNSNFIWDNANERLGIGSSSPTGRVVIQGKAGAPAAEPLLEIKNSSGQQIMAVYNDSIHFFISDIASNKGGFAVSGRNNSKALTNDFLRINADSTRIWTGDTIKGFGVKNIGLSAKTSYMQLTPLNYLIGHQAGKSTTGKYNFFAGYQSGFTNTTGYKNYFIGYRSGYKNTSGYSNILIGDSAGFNNTSGFKNIMIGNQSGYTNTTGNYNVFLGYNTGYMNNASYNAFLGFESGKNNTTGSYNSFIGYQSGYGNSTGGNNIFLGYQAGYSNISSLNNVFIGNQAGYTTNYGSNNVFLGYQAGFKNTSGYQNVFTGYQAGYENTTGYENAFIGYLSGQKNTTGMRGVFIGWYAGQNNTTGNYNVFVGRESGKSTTTGSSNTCVGESSGSSNTTGDNNTYIGKGAGAWQINGRLNVFLGGQAGLYSTGGNNNIHIGWNTGAHSNGNNNIVMGFMAAYGSLLDSNNVIIGYNAGMSNLDGVSNTLWMANNNSSDPLIYGNFNTGFLGFGTITPTSKLTAVDDVVTNDNPAVLGTHAVTDYYGVGVKGVGKYKGVEGSVNLASGSAFAVYANASGAGTGTRYGVYGTASGGATAYAGYFSGNVNVTGTLSKGGGSFKIDHPLDPENKYLYHSFVESPDMKNIYDGVVVLDNDGKAIVTLPDWFEALNDNFRYQLTSIGAPGPNLYISKEVSGNVFEIAGGTPGMKVSWMLTGIRHDPFAEKNRIPTEVDKSDDDKGYYLYPEAYGLPATKGIDAKSNGLLKK